jgi:hypothetical protein
MKRTVLKQLATARAVSPPNGDNTPKLAGAWLVFAGALAAVFVGGIVATAQATGLFCLIFPEMGALAYDVFTRPAGIWSRSAFYLVVTPGLTAVFGLLVAQHFPYGYLSVLLSVGAAAITLKVMRSPISPSLSAALLPVVFHQQSWWYPVGVFLGAVSLAILTVIWRKACAVPSPAGSIREKIFFGSSAEKGGGDGYFELLCLGIFLVAVFFCVNLTGFHLLLYPPLAVIAYGVFRRANNIFSAYHFLLMPLACGLTAAGGLCAVKWWGVSVLAAVAGMAWSFLVLAALRIYLPPAVAVSLIPLIAPHLSLTYPLAVTVGTLLLTFCYFTYRLVISHSEWNTAW